MVGNPAEARWLREDLEKRFENKTVVVGSKPELGEAKKRRVLKRVVRVTEEHTGEADFSAKGMHMTRNSTPSDEKVLTLARENGGRVHHLGAHTLRLINCFTEDALQREVLAFDLASLEVSVSRN